MSHKFEFIFTALDTTTGHLHTAVARLFAAYDSSRLLRDVCMKGKWETQGGVGGFNFSFPSWYLSLIPTLVPNLLIAMVLCSPWLMCWCPLCGTLASLPLTPTVECFSARCFLITMSLPQEFAPRDFHDAPQ